MKERLIREIGHEFSLQSVLGKGAFGIVIESINLTTHKQVALKVIKKYKLTEKQIVFSIQESELLSRLDHPNIVNFIGLHHTESFLILEMELLKGKTLADLLATRRLKEDEAAYIMQMVFEGVSYLHRVQVLHRDLKPANIMFKDKDLQTLKIADFGLSTKYTLEERLNARSGTMAYMAPEQVFQKQYSEPVDIWSCGIILYQILTNSHPLATKGEDTQTYLKTLQHIEWKFPDNFPPLAKDLFLRCTTINPLERYTASLALQHPWITRNKGAIPLTPLEEVRLYHDKLKIKKLLIAAIQLSGFIPGAKLRENYLTKVKDPFARPKIENLEKETTKKKTSSTGSIDIRTNTISLKSKNKRQDSYGNHLEVPGKKKTASASSTPRENLHIRNNIRSFLGSPTPSKPGLPKSASKPTRHKSEIH